MVRVKLRSVNPAKVSLDKALEVAVAQVDRVGLSEASRYMLLAWWGELISYARSAHGARFVADLTPHLVGQWIRALTKERTEPRVHTVRSRRHGVRKFFQVLRLAGVKCMDPTADIVLPGGDAIAPVRPLTDAEVLQLRAPQEFNMTTRRAAIWALLQEGATTREIAKVTLGSIDLKARTLRLPGCHTTVPRVVELGRWQGLGSWTVEALEARVAYMRETGAGDDDLLLYSGKGTEAVAQVAVGRELSHLWRLAGLENDVAVRPRSIRSWLGWKILNESGRIEEVARVLGMRSLDQTALLLGWRWQDGAA